MAKILSPEKTELAAAYSVAAVGAVQGAFKYYVAPELTAKRSWAAIGLLVATHDLLCQPGELLSEGADRALLKQPLLTKAAIGVVALHLANLLPERVDPLHQLFRLVKGETSPGQ